MISRIYKIYLLLEKLILLLFSWYTLAIIRNNRAQLVHRACSCDEYLKLLLFGLSVLEVVDECSEWSEDFLHIRNFAELALKWGKLLMEAFVVRWLVSCPNWLQIGAGWRGWQLWEFCFLKTEVLLKLLCCVASRFQEPLLNFSVVDFFGISLIDFAFFRAGRMSHFPTISAGNEFVFGCSEAFTWTVRVDAFAAFVCVTTVARSCLLFIACDVKGKL